MNGTRIVALIAGRSLHEDGEEGPLSAAIAVVRAVLERNGRVLLGAEPSLLVPILMAAAEYREIREVETAREVPAAPIILAPLERGREDLEDFLLGYHEEAPEGEPTTSLLGDLSAIGLIEPGHPLQFEDGSPAKVFFDLLSRREPRAILWIGDSSPGASPFVRAAERYASDQRVQLWKILRTKRDGDRRWRPVRPWAEDMPPPMFEGRILGEQKEDRAGDESLLLLGRRAAAEASLTLAIDQTVGKLLGEPGERRGRAE